MRGGDISNESPPRFVITFDCLFHLPDSERTSAVLAYKLHRWEKALAHWELDRQMAGRMWLAEGRYGIRWELAVFDRTAGFREAIVDRLDAENIGVANVSSFVSPQALASSLAYRPDIHAVVDIPDRGLYYGSRGTDPRSL